jgi:hypothetical protein
VKYVVISRFAPGVESSRKALEVFLKAGLPRGTEAIYAALDGKTYITILESEEGNPDLLTTYTYSPFFEETKVFPVVAMDEAWLQAVQGAVAAWA